MGRLLISSLKDSVRNFVSELQGRQEMATITPELRDFVLYADRGLRMARHVTVLGGDLGVRSTAPPSFGMQVELGSSSVIDECHNVFGPSVDLGRHVEVGPIHANSLHDNRIRLGAPMGFPGESMPPLPLAPAPPGLGPDVNVACDQVLAMLPGQYGTLAVAGTLLLNPGFYTFACARLADRARVIAIAGEVEVWIRDDLTAGRGVAIYPAFGKAADQLAIFVSGTDETLGRPAVSLGERGAIDAILAAPHGTVSFADHVHARGAFAGFDITLGEHVHVDFQCGFPVDGRGQRGSQQLSGYSDYGKIADPNVLPLLGPVPADTVIRLSIGLPIRDRAGLNTFIKRVSDPKDPMFRQYLTPAQFDATYGASDADYQALKDWATSSSGFAIKATYPSNLLLSVAGTAAQIERALFVNLVYRRRRDGSSFIAVDREPSLDLSVPVLHISGLTDVVLPRPANGTGGARAAPSSAPPTCAPPTWAPVRSPRSWTAAARWSASWASTRSTRPTSLPMPASSSKPRASPR
jgi:hypothetical protein